MDVVVAVAGVAEVALVFSVEAVLAAAKVILENGRGVACVVLDDDLLFTDKAVHANAVAPSRSSNDSNLMPRRFILRKLFGNSNDAPVATMCES